MCNGHLHIQACEIFTIADLLLLGLLLHSLTCASPRPFVPRLVTPPQTSTWASQSAGRGGVLDQNHAVHW